MTLVDVVDAECGVSLSVPSVVPVFPCVNRGNRFCYSLMESTTIPPSTEGTEASLTPSKGPPKETAASLKHDDPPQAKSKRKDDVTHSSNSRSKKSKVSNEASLPTATTNGVEGEDEEGQPPKFLSRREANRIHAFKSRQRSKHLLQELQQLVTQYNYEKLELERQNAVLTAQVEVLQQQNMTLLQSHPPPAAPTMYAAPPNSQANATHQWLQTLLQAVSAAQPQQQQQPQAWPNAAPAAASSSWMMNMLLAAAAANANGAVAAPPQPTWTSGPVAAPPAPREEWHPGNAAAEPQQQLQRAFQQAKEAPPASAEKPTLHPV
jgi:nitroreductase